MYCAGAGTEPCVLTVQYTSPQYLSQANAPWPSHAARVSPCAAFAPPALRVHRRRPPSGIAIAHRAVGCADSRSSTTRSPSCASASSMSRSRRAPPQLRPRVHGCTSPPRCLAVPAPPTYGSRSSHLRLPLFPLALPLFPLALLLGRRVEYSSIGTQRLLRPRIRDAQGVLSVLLEGYSQLSTLACSLGRHLPSRLCQPIRTCAPCDRRRVSIARSGAYGCPGAATHVGAW